MAEIPILHIPKNLTRFVLDVHLGRLARHLRMLGIDALWRDDFEDSELQRIAREEERVLLTRDRALAEATEKSHWVKATDHEEQLREVLTEFQLTPWALSGRGFLTRCLQCNSLILPVAGHQIHDRIPGHLLLEHQEFYLCTRCERVYWRGSHVDRMAQWVSRVLQSEFPKC
jgi:uncharacterized protein with PIN domain